MESRHGETHRTQTTFNNRRTAQALARLPEAAREGTVAADAARRVGRASAWITSLARRYNRDGAAAVTRKNSTKPSHRANSLRVPERISLPRVPAYSPELNPSERVWPLVKEGVANRAHENLAELEQRVCSSCQ